jgi:nucleoside-diphosphate-sugar epimerase
MKYFVTGATGFIEGHLVAKLIARGDRSLAWCATQTRRRVWLSRRELVKGDVSDRAVMREAMRGVDGVFHIARCTSSPRIQGSMYAAIVDGTRNALEAAIEAGAGRSCIPAQ